MKIFGIGVDIVDNNRFKKLSRHVKDLFKDIPEKKRRNKYRVVNFYS